MGRITPLATVSLVVLSFHSPFARAQTSSLECSGEAEDHRSVYAASIYLSDETRRPERVLVMQREVEDDTWHLTADYTAFDDTTPTYPSDLVYRYVFHADDAQQGDPAVRVTTGGFTGGTTSAVISLGDDDATREIAIMPCWARRAATPQRG